MSAVNKNNFDMSTMTDANRITMQNILGEKQPWDDEWVRIRIHPTDQED